MTQQIILTLAVLATWTFMTGFLWIIAVTILDSTGPRSKWISLFGLIFALSLLSTAVKAIVIIFRIWT